MAARSRPRAGQIKDEIDEERSLWNQIKSDGRKFDQLMVRRHLFAIIHPRCIPSVQGMDQFLLFVNKQIVIATVSAQASEATYDVHREPTLSWS
jgi:hypothetical protein